MNVLSCACLHSCFYLHIIHPPLQYRPKDGDVTDPQLYEVPVEDLSETLTRKGLFDILEKVLSERGREREREIIRNIQ